MSTLAGQGPPRASARGLGVDRQFESSEWSAMTDPRTGMRKSLRSYVATVQVTYLGGSLPADTQAALADALGSRADELISELDVANLSGPYDTTYISAAVRARNSVEAIDALVRAVDSSMMETGVFEKFDVTGKVLQAAPREAAEKIERFHPPA
jgi:hypothetical protein